ncbi:hypothetical protein NEMBOFW57_003301 [Staphylotrichum longicolle]|uniref:Uncharacterized protein n=1 Tax=Staphylotrichum longicolle TaxID=669026 RepID=A0AAD4F5X5_9PEZI|nr:hypothetical protein NEMBOFW57_003301 [Staphylotrichum longicolle]
MLYDLNIAWSPGTPPAELERTLKFAKNLGYDVPPPAPHRPPPRHADHRRPGHHQLPPGRPRARYDLLALRPTSDKSFSWACLATTDPPALISLDLSAHLGWHIHHRTAMAAVQKACASSQAFGGGSDGSGGVEAARQRANFIGNVQMLLRATKGRASEARGALGLRAPADVGFAALGEEARAVVVNEGIKRRGFRGVVDIVRPAEGGPEVRRGVEEEEKAGGGKGKKQKQKQQQQQQQQGQGQKRKNGGEGGGNAGGQQGEMSKRQAKKIKKDGAQAKA